MDRAGRTCSEGVKGSQSICRAIELIRTIARYNDQGARLSDISRRVGLNTSTVHRILSVLTEEGLITHDKTTKLYHLGLELYLLGNQAHQFSARNQFRSSLERIEERTENTAFLLIPSGNDVLCIDRVEGRHPVRTVTVDVGARRPLGIGAGSLSLIAFRPEEEFRAMVRTNASRYGRYQGLTAEDILRLGAEARERGYVVSKGLFHYQVISVGVPIFDAGQGPVAAITVSATSDRMNEETRDNIAQLVWETVRSEGAVS